MHCMQGDWLLLCLMLLLGANVPTVFVAAGALVSLLIKWIAVTEPGEIKWRFFLQVMMVISFTFCGCV